jgi:hypothetical protein
MTAEVTRWQQSLWRFTSVGHIGKVGGPKAWMEAISPMSTGIELRQKFPESPEGQPVSLYLTAYDAGDGNSEDFVLWQQPRLVAPGRPDLPLRDVQNLVRELSTRREKMLAVTDKYLNACVDQARL